jgi:hypothetical protein
VLRALAGWYYRLHQGGRHVATQRLYSENDDLNRETLAFLREKLPEAGELLDYVGERMEFFRGFIGEREDTIVYNDFYYTCYNMAYKIIKQQETSTVNYREFYAEELFDEIKEELDYTDEWSVAYGMHPAILHYNGIHTLDGYLGFYTQEYKEKFREVIAPALETSEEFRDYFDSWGPRAYIYSGAGENTYEPVRYMELTDKNLSINSVALKDMGCKYIFSRIELDNAKELQLTPLGVFEKENLPYVIYVYEL